MNLETQSKILRIIAEHRSCKISTIDPTATLESIGFDSLDTVELIINFEDEFDVGLETDTIEVTSTVADVVACIQAQLT